MRKIVDYEGHVTDVLYHIPKKQVRKIKNTMYLGGSLFLTADKGSVTITLHSRGGEKKQIILNPSVVGDVLLAIYMKQKNIEYSQKIDVSFTIPKNSSSFMNLVFSTGGVKTKTVSIDKKKADFVIRKSLLKEVRKSNKTKSVFLSICTAFVMLLVMLIIIKKG